MSALRALQILPSPPPCAHLPTPKQLPPFLQLVNYRRPLAVRCEDSSNRCPETAHGDGSTYSINLTFPSEQLGAEQFKARTTVSVHSPTRLLTCTKLRFPESQRYAALSPSSGAQGAKNVLPLTSAMTRRAPWASWLLLHDTDVNSFSLEGWLLLTWHD